MKRKLARWGIRLLPILFASLLLINCGSGAPPASIPAPVSQNLSISPPGPNGAVEIKGSAGAVQPNANVQAQNVTQVGPFSILEFLFERKAMAQIFTVQVQADNQGAFDLFIDAVTGDRIDVRQEVNGDFSPPVSLTVP